VNIFIKYLTQDIPDIFPQKNATLLKHYILQAFQNRVFNDSYTLRFKLHQETEYLLWNSDISEKSFHQHSLMTEQKTLVQKLTPSYFCLLLILCIIIKNCWKHSSDLL